MTLTFYGRNFDDYLTHIGWSDITSYGGKGNDAIYGANSSGYPFIYYSNDVLVGGLGSDRSKHFGTLDINQADSDTIYGGQGDDLIYGGDYDPYAANRSMDGNDFLYGGEGNDKLYGDRGDDLLDGGNDYDELYGDEGNDLLNGGSGNDLLVGGSGNDTLTGGADRDNFRFDSPSNKIDRITDFSVADDTILINKRGFGLSFTGGRAIPSSAFRKGYDSAAALTSAQRFIPHSALH